MEVLLSIFATLVIVGIALRAIRSFSPIKPREIYQMISKQELAALETQISRRGPIYMDSFVVSSQNFCCEYVIKRNQYGLLKTGVLETIRITIPGRNGCLSAIFCNDKLAAWSIGGRGNISLDIPDDERWAMEQIFGRVQNAVELKIQGAHS